MKLKGKKIKLLKEIFLWGVGGVLIFTLSTMILIEGLPFKPSLMEVLVITAFVIISAVFFNIVEKYWRHKQLVIFIMGMLELMTAYCSLKIILRCLDMPISNALLNYLLVLILTSPVFFIKRKMTGYVVCSSVCLMICAVVDVCKEGMYYDNVLEILKKVLLSINKVFSLDVIICSVFCIVLLLLVVIFLYKKEKDANINMTKWKVMILVILFCLLVPAKINFNKDNIYKDFDVRGMYSALKLCVRNIKLSEYKYIENDELPIIRFEGDFSGITKDNEKMVSITYESDNQSFEAYSRIKWQGTSSLRYPKKNYTIKLYSDANGDEKFKTDFEGWGEQNKFCLKANFIDFTQARNVVSAKIGGQIAEDIWPVDAPNNGCVDGFPVRVVINGIYQGLYTLNIPKDGWMFGMDEENENHMVWCAEQNNDGYNVSDEILACEFRGLAKGNEQDWSLEFPEEQNEYNLAALNRVILFVKDSSDERFVEDFEKYFNKEAVLNYYIFQYFSAGIDGLAKNMLMITYDGEIWYPSLYDLDSTWGLFVDGHKLMDYHIQCPDEYQDTNSLLWKRVEKLFSDDLYSQYLELRTDVLSVENVVKEFEMFTDKIDTEFYEEDKRIWPEIPSKDFTSFEQIKEFVGKRAEYVDRVFEEKFN